MKLSILHMQVKPSEQNNIINLFDTLISQLLKLEPFGSQTSDIFIIELDLKIGIFPLEKLSRAS